MTTEVGLLTTRLAFLMKQVTENQLKELVIKDRLRLKEGKIKEKEREKMISYEKSGSAELNEPLSFKNIKFSKKIEYQSNEEPKKIDGQNRFRKAARLTVMFSGARNICTCSSLDAHCYIHDS